MTPSRLTIELLSDTTFGRGEGTAGEVDVEVEHDGLGLPFVGGKTVHGLLRDAWLSMAPAFSHLHGAALTLLGQAQELVESSVVRVGDAVVDDTTRRWIAAAVTRQPPETQLRAGDVLRALTDVRRQTAQDRGTGAPTATTLRAVRVVVRGLTLEAPLAWLVTPDAGTLRCLALCALGVRHAGLSRNRGRGHVRVLLDGDRALTERLVKEARP